MDLALDDHRVDLRSAVVHARRSVRIDLPGLGSTSTMAKCVPNGKTKLAGSKKPRPRGPGSMPGRKVPGDVGHQGHVLEGLGSAGVPFTWNFPSLVHVLVRRLEQVGAIRPRLLPDLPRAPGPARRRPPRWCGCRRCPSPSASCRCRRAITFMSSTSTPSSSATICAKVVSSPWPCGLRADEDVTCPTGGSPHDGAVLEAAAEADRAGHLRGTEAADLDVGGDADAEVAALAAGLGLLVPEAGVVDLLQSAFSSAPW